MRALSLRYRRQSNADAAQASHGMRVTYVKRQVRTRRHLPDSRQAAVVMAENRPEIASHTRCYTRTPGEDHA